MIKFLSSFKYSLIVFLILQSMALKGLGMQRYGDIERVRVSAKFDESRELQLHQTLGKTPGQPNGSLGVFFKKSDKVAGYADGIIELSIDSAKAPAPNALVFSKYAQLKNKPNALLILKLNGTFKKRSFSLPIMDVVIEGDDFPESKFIFHGNTNVNKQIYFIGAQKHDVAIKISGPSSSSPFGGSVWAMTPPKLVRTSDSLPFIIEQFKIAPVKPQPMATPSLAPLAFPVLSSPALFPMLNPITPMVMPVFGLQTVPQISHSPASLPHLVPPRTQILPDTEMREDKPRANNHRELWPHQSEQIRQSTIAREKGINQWTVVSATGTGKSYTMQNLIKTLDNSTVVLLLTSRKNLITQLAQDFAADDQLKVVSSDAANTNIKNFIRTAVNAKDDKKQNVIITTLQGFQSLMPDHELLRGIHMIVFDEAHNLLSPKRTHMVFDLKNIAHLKLVFFTATPTRLHTKADATYSVYQLSDENEHEPHVKPFTIKQAVEAGINAPYQLVHVKGPELNLKLEKTNGEYRHAETSKQINKPKYHRMIFDIYLHAVRGFAGGTAPLFGEYAMAFCADIDHTESLASYLNEQNTSVAAHKSAYEHSIRSFVGQFEGTVAPPGLKTLWKATYPSRTSFANQFFAANDLKKLADDFLKAFPYVFADAVHSGNERIKHSEAVVDARLLRNKHGGSTILCGADKLTEGFDNPKISIAFLVDPVRKSNTLATQRFGRILRVNPHDKTKVAVAIEFLWDKEQLLLSSIDLLNSMYAGPQGASVFEIPEHESDVIEYFLSTELVTEGTFLRPEKARKKDLARPQGTAKRKRDKEQPLTQKDVLVDQLEHVLIRLEKFCQELMHYTLKPHEEVMDLVPREALTSAHYYPPREAALIIVADERYTEQVAKRAEDAMARIKDFFHEERPSKMPRMPLLDDDTLPHSYVIAKSNDDSNRKLFKRVMTAINQAKSFMAQCQFQNQTQAYADLLNEIIITANALAKETLVEVEGRELNPIYTLPIPVAPSRIPQIVDLTKEGSDFVSVPDINVEPCDVSMAYEPFNAANTVPVTTQPFAPYAISFPNAHPSSFLQAQPQNEAYLERTFMIAWEANKAFESYRSKTVTLGIMNFASLNPEQDIAEAVRVILLKYDQNADEIKTSVRHAFFVCAARYLWEIETLALKHFYFNVLINLLSYANKFPQEEFDLKNAFTPIIERDRKGKFKNDDYWKLLFP